MSRRAPHLRSDELAACWQELLATGEEAEELAADLTRTQLWWRPSADRWSVGECLDHLVRAGEAYLEVLDEEIDQARRRGWLAEGPYRPSLVGRWLPRLLEPPPGLKVRAPRRIRPRRPEAGTAEARARGARDRQDRTPAVSRSAGGDPAAGQDPLARFLALRPRLGERLEAGEGLDLGRIRVTSPFVPLLRFDLGSAFRVIAAHERRHLWQARRVKEEEGFPGGVPD